MAKKRETVEESAKGNTGSPGGANKVKVIVAVFAFLVAGGLLAWNFGLFAGTPTPPPTVEQTYGPEEMAEMEKETEKTRQIQKMLKPPSGS